MRLSFIILIFGFILFACKKDKLPELPISNNPIFRIEGTIDGESFQFIAGMDEFNLTADNRIIQRVEHLSSELSNNHSLIRFLLSDGNIDIPKSEKLDLSSLDFLQLTNPPAEPLLVLDKNHLSNAEYIERIDWWVNGQLMASNETLIIYEPGVYDICPQITFINQQTAELCQQVILGYKKNATNTLRVMASQTGNIIAYFDTPENEIERIDWYINDSLVETDKHNLVFNFLGDDLHISATVYNTNGTVRKKSVYYHTLNPMHYIQDLSSFENQTNHESDFRTLIQIEHNGMIYTSMTSTGEAVILDHAHYKDPVSGKTFTKLTGQLNGQFYSSLTNENVLVNLTFTLAFPRFF